MSEFQREARFFAELPVMPLREVVMLPRTIMPLFVGREASIKAIELAQSGYNKQMFLVAQREPDVEKPGADDLSPVGVVCKVLQMLRLPDGTIKVLFEGLHRARWTELREEDNCLMAMLCTVPESESRPEEREALVRTVQEALEEYAKNNKKLTQEALMSIMALRDAGPLADAVVPHLKVDYRKKQEVLEIADVTERLERVYELLQGEVALASVEKRIKNRVKVQMERNQREYYLSEQLKAINKEMGREDDPQAEVDELEKKLEGRNMPQEARERCQSELRKLRSMPPSAAEYTVVRNYVDWLLDLPWNDLKEISTSKRPVPSLKATTSVWKSPRTASWNIWPCRSSPTACAVPSSASWARQAWARPRWPRAWPGPRDANMCAFPWAACVTRPRSAVTAVPMWAPCPARSSSP